MKQHQFEEALNLGPAQLNVLNEVGRVEILPHDGRSILINAETRHMEINVSRNDNTVVVRAEIDAEWRNPITRLTALFNKEKGPKANLIVHIPSDCEVISKTVTGKQTISDVAAPVTSRVITGETRLSNLNGPIYAKTITGDLRYDGALTDDTHRFETITGTVRLNLTEEPNTRLKIRTMTGHIKCDWPLNKTIERRHVVGAKLTDTLGNGAGIINTRVTTGNVRLALAQKTPQSTFPDVHVRESA